MLTHMGYGSDTVLEVVEPLIMPLWNLRPAFSLWCGSWEQMQLRGEIQTPDQLYKMETPSKLSLGEGLALFAAGTYPAREYLPEGGRWMMATRKDGMDEAWLALGQSLLHGFFDGQAGVCGVAFTWSSTDGKLAIWLQKAQDDMHVLAVGRVFMDFIAKEHMTPRLKFENFQRGKVTLHLRP